MAFGIVLAIASYMLAVRDSRFHSGMLFFTSHFIVGQTRRVARLKLAAYAAAVIC